MTTGTANAPARWQKQRKRSSNQMPSTSGKTLRLCRSHATAGLRGRWRAPFAHSGDDYHHCAGRAPSFRWYSRRNYELQRSSDLQTWSTIAMLTAPLHGIMQYDDPSPAFLPDAPALNPGTVAAALNRRRCPPAGTWRGRIWSPPVVGGDDRRDAGGAAFLPHYGGIIRLPEVSRCRIVTENFSQLPCESAPSYDNQLPSSTGQRAHSICDLGNCSFADGVRGSICREK